MNETVAINGITLCHKNSTGWVRSTLPDVCKSPTIPVPYTNIAFARDLAKGTTTVLSHGGAMNGIKGSEFSISYGDEPGVGGGVISGVNKHRATFLSWSPNVFMEGKPVTRLTDRMLMNKGNTISAGGYYTGPVTGPDKPLLDILCNIACECKVAGTAQQTCVDLAVKAMPHTPQNGIFSEVTFDPSGKMYTMPDGTPMTRMGVPGSRLDVIAVAGGQPVSFVEMKFPGDRFRGSQRSRYQAIAAQNGKQLNEITVATDCLCTDSKPEPVKVPATEEEKKEAPASAGLTTGEKVAVGAGGLAVVGAIACIVLEPCGAIVAGGAATAAAATAAFLGIGTLVTAAAGS
ncbi:DUF4150 domain-containing protein [Phyllobacterium sp. 628]|uniref:PAAR-like domain-containing protein n=1 Tax=Phyllobacterium sp. 628 TaxID=2718938 RepID=UPI00166281EE|nr:PAAR-like domain-containing protein [Phyllobacterium sp. 628]QND51897.1 DUF4150 domain-containing protein [Phyllobacterium sp. 628]